MRRPLIALAIAIPLALPAIGAGGATQGLPQFMTTISVPDPTTGAINGFVAPATAPETPLAYSAPGATAKGAVSVTASGTFVYTPTAAARHAAARTSRPGATTDAFTVTVTDGHGATAPVAVTLPISPADAAPVAVARRRTVTGVSAATGVVTGRVCATDADGDPLTYRATTQSTPRGSLAMNPSTGAFTYTPTAAARRAAAAAPGPRSAARSDSFTVTVSDGYGGHLRVGLRVPIR